MAENESASDAANQTGSALQEPGQSQPPSAEPGHPTDDLQAAIEAAGSAASPTDDDEDKYQYQIKVEDAGPAAKKVTIEIPQDRIAAKLDEQMKTLRREAALPGFRPGHAPQRLIEKRFGNEVREQVRRDLVNESYQQAIERHSLQVLGEAEFDQADKMQLPAAGPLVYSFNVEVQPEIKLPELMGLKVKKPKIEVKDENVDQAMTNLRQQQGTLIPVDDRGVEAQDYLTADVHVKVDGNVVSHQHAAQLVARPGRIAGIHVEDLDKQLEGMKPDETRAIAAKASETHPNEALRNKDVEIEIALKDIKKLELPEVDQEFLDALGFAGEQELRDALREQMIERIEQDVQQSMREQVSRYLLDNVQIELPAKLSEQQTQRLLRRRKVDLVMRGVSDEQANSLIAESRAAIETESARDMKLYFILQQVAQDQNAEVTEGELNGRIAMLAAQRGRRPEKLKQEMAADNSLAEMYLQMREQKALDAILGHADIEVVEVEKTDAAAGEAPAEASASAPEASAPADSESSPATESGQA